MYGMVRKVLGVEVGDGDGVGVMCVSCGMWYVSFDLLLLLLLLFPRCRCSCRRRFRRGGKCIYNIDEGEGLKRRSQVCVGVEVSSFLLLRVEWDDWSDKSNTPVFYGGGGVWLPWVA